MFRIYILTNAKWYEALSIRIKLDGSMRVRKWENHLRNKTLSTSEIVFPFKNFRNRFALGYAVLLDWLEGPSDPGAPCVPFKPQQLIAATTCVTLWTIFLKIFPIWILDFFCWSGPTESSSICSSQFSSLKPQLEFALHLSWEDLFWLIWGTLQGHSTIWQSLTPGI